jgi:hypothetical protein
VVGWLPELAEWGTDTHGLHVGWHVHREELQEEMVKHFLPKILVPSAYKEINLRLSIRP